MVVISWLWNGKDFSLSPKQLLALYTDVRHWDELVEFMDENGGPKEPYILTSMFKCILEQDRMDKEYIGSYTHGNMIHYPIYGQISFNCCFSNAVKLKLGHNVKIIMVQMMRATGKEMAEHVIRPV